MQEVQRNWPLLPRCKSTLSGPSTSSLTHRSAPRPKPAPAVIAVPSTTWSRSATSLATPQLSPAATARKSVTSPATVPSPRTGARCSAKTARSLDTPSRYASHAHPSHKQTQANKHNSAARLPCQSTEATAMPTPTPTVTPTVMAVLLTGVLRKRLPPAARRLGAATLVVLGAGERVP
jgi:hypothetical protein